MNTHGEKDTQFIVSVQDAQMKLSLMQKMEEMQRSLDKTSLNTPSDVIVEEFPVPSELMGLVIGANGRNITVSSILDLQR